MFHDFKGLVYVFASKTLTLFFLIFKDQIFNLSTKNSNKPIDEYDAYLVINKLKKNLVQLILSTKLIFFSACDIPLFEMLFLLRTENISYFYEQF